MEWFTVIMLVAGLLLVVLGSDILVDGASDIARRSGISEFVIGMTIVGIGTSLPEMVVSWLGAIKGNADIAIGNIIGSNIFNTCIILGVTALILPMAITKASIRRDIPLNITSTLLLVFLGMKHSIFGIGNNELSRIDGVVMLVCFAIYLYYSFKFGKNETCSEETQQPNITDKKRNCVRSILMIVGGFAALIGGGELFVDNAVCIARDLGWSDKFIGITILAGGTSLPELATCIAAAIKKKGQLALGNIIGSNISNILLILGGAAVIHPLSMSNINAIDIGFLILSALFLLAAYFTFDKRQLDRIEGAVLLGIEVVYMSILIYQL